MHHPRYYDRLYVEESLSLDDALVKEYFPVDVIVPTILEIYQDLLGVKFEEVKGNLWHPGACRSLKRLQLAH
jgi:Zn-dependent oligopeptidase